MTQFETCYHLMKKPWVIALYTGCVILAYLFIDQPLALGFYHLDGRSHLWVFKLFTLFGVASFYFILLAIAVIYYRYINKNPVYEKKIWFLIACISICNIFCGVVKVLLGRARPELFFSEHLFGFYGLKLSGQYWSFPSGHTTTIIAIASGLGILFPKRFFLFLFFAFFVILSRVVLYYHYLSDVMVGFYFCILIVGLLFDYCQRTVWNTVLMPSRRQNIRM